MKSTNWIGLSGIAGVCCLVLPMALAAQGTTAEQANPLAGSAGSSMGMPSSTSGQMTPGVTRPNPNGPGSFNGEQPGAMGATADSSAMDKRFLEEASAGGMAEIQFGELASEKASSDKVKAYGQKMVTDHTSLNNQLKPFADKAGVVPPTDLKAEDKAEYDKLNGLSGQDFDREYVAFMMRDHKQDQTDFRREAAVTTNPQLKMAVQKGEKVISEHKQMIDKMGASMGVATKI